NIIFYGNNDRVSQPENTVEILQGQEVKLLCFYDTTSNAPDLFWYIQRPNNSPQHLLTRSSGYNPSAEDARFDATLNTSEKTVHLSISSATLSDSAIYFCALRPTILKRNLTI
uniref:Ig-like domain-containing protein n=1 Tax=Erpetoichthys calabaricus TaxID=27687 RepID=A0A8C4S2Y0_ERPCA